MLFLLISAGLLLWYRRPPVYNPPPQPRFQSNPSAVCRGAIVRLGREKRSPRGRRINVCSDWLVSVGEMSFSIHRRSFQRWNVLQESKHNLTAGPRGRRPEEESEGRTSLRPSPPASFLSPLPRHPDLQHIVGPASWNRDTLKLDYSCFAAAWIY